MTNDDDTSDKPSDPTAPAAARTAGAGSPRDRDPEPMNASSSAP